jgi:hypothetical protein
MQVRANKQSRREAGGVLVEFSISIMALWLILAATLDFGRAFAASHLLQSAARTAARELSLNPELPYNLTFDRAIESIFDPRYLVLDLTCVESQARTASPGQTPNEWIDLQLQSSGLLLNQMLRPLMIYEEVTVAGRPWRLMRYPGALLTQTDSQPMTGCLTPFRVGVPQIDPENSRVVFHRVVEELTPNAFQLVGNDVEGVQRGTVTVRLHYPFQAVGLSSWRIVDGVNRVVNVSETDGLSVDPRDLDRLRGRTIDALDTVDADGNLAAYAQGGAGDPIPVYGGRLGLGTQLMLGQRVRPFRRVITAQAVAPREIVGGLGS